MKNFSYMSSLPNREGEANTATQNVGGLSVVGGGRSLGHNIARSACSLNTASRFQIYDGLINIQIHLLLKTGHGRYAIH
jgi:hypothetical protein